MPSAAFLSADPMSGGPKSRRKGEAAARHRSAELGNTVGAAVTTFIRCGILAHAAAEMLVIGLNVIGTICILPAAP